MEIESNLQDRQFGSLEAELSVQKQHAELLSDRERAADVESIRSAVSACGLSTSSISHTRGADAQKGGGKMAVASYNPTGKKISSVGTDEMIQGAESAGLGVGEFAQAIFRHELAHA
ncbi:MAG: hypothetical protein OEY44_00805, partial [Candidatus Peregrinibacteria bacterium]|nr:hypothetical protein [Candidatus Peregrinibacteria bacterium]